MSTVWAEQFLALREQGMLEGKALKALQVSRRALRELRTIDPDFASREDDIHQANIDELEEEAIKRAIEGENVFDKEGNCVGTKKSDQLLMFLLKGNRRSTYGDKSEIKHDSDLVIQIRDIASENNVDLETAKRLSVQAALKREVTVKELDL